MASRRTRRARLTALVIGSFAALVLVEVVLQAVAYLQWRRHEAARATPGAHRVHCVGDSFTFGLGADRPQDESYPRVLASLVAATDANVEVVNDGWPGSTSAEVLRAVVAAVDRSTSVVYVLVGVNDLTRRPALVTHEEEAAARAADRGFPWRCRLAVLAALVVDRLQGGPAYTPDNQRAATAPPFLGVWHLGNVELRFTPDGAASLGVDRHRWRLDGDAIVLESEAGAPPLRLVWRIEGKTLVVRPRDYDELSFEPGPSIPAVIARADELASTLGVAAAEASLRAALDDTTDGPAARYGLVRRLVARGALDEARELRAGFATLAADPGSGARAYAIRAAVVVGAFDAALELGLGTSLVPNPLWEALDEAAGSASDRATIAAALGRAAASGSLAANFAMNLHRHRAVLLRDVDAAGSLDSLLRAFLLAEQDDRERLVAWSFRSLTDTSGEALDAAIHRLALATDEATLVRMTFARELDGVDAAMAILDAHLRRIVAASRDAVATPVLLTYPFPFPRHRAVVLAVGRETDTVVLDLESGFPSIGDPARAALFAPDGHCNAAGYAAMAHLVEADLRPRLLGK